MNLRGPGVAAFETETIVHVTPGNYVINLVGLALFNLLPLHLSIFRSPFPILVFALFHLLALSKVLCDRMSESKRHFGIDGHGNTISGQNNNDGRERKYR
jgi:hypothetical protein